MFAVSKRNILLPGPNGERFFLKKDCVGPVPGWTEHSSYFQALVEDGKVILSASGTDKDFSQKEKKPKHVAG